MIEAIMFDTFYCDLGCHSCGKVANGGDGNLQTMMCNRPFGNSLPIGVRLDVDWERLDRRGYICVRRPESRGSMVLLDLWDCPYCGKAFNWAAIQLRDGVLVRIESVVPSLAALNAANYLGMGFRYILENPEVPDSELLVAVQHYLENLDGEGG